MATFWIGDHYCGVGTEDVHEILRQQPVTRVPLAHTLVSGLLNLRGQVVTVSDLRLRFGLPERPAEIRPTTVVLRTSGALLGLLVDRIGEVVDLDLGLLRPPPENSVEVGSDLIAGVLELMGQRLLVLDPARYFR